MRTIRVTGKGQMKIRPDTTRIMITLEGLYPEYGEALRKSASDTEKIKELLSEFGFDSKDSKTVAFSAEPEYENYRESGAYRQRLTGYRYRHVLKLDFDSDNDRLGRILYALGHSPLHPEIRICYTVKDPEEAKNELLAKAVLDAKEKAAVLAQAAGVNLKNIENVDYSWGEIDFETQPVKNLVMADGMTGESGAYTKFDMDIEPDDMDLSDTVTVVWEIG